MQIASTVFLILLQHHAHVCNPNRDRWNETQAFQGKESSKKFVETSEASFYLCSSFSHYLNKLSEGNSLQDFQTQQEGVEARKAGSTRIILVVSIFCDPVKRVVSFNLGLPR